MALTANICLAIALVVIVFLLYKESISIKQVAGITVCGIGLWGLKAEGKIPVSRHVLLREGKSIDISAAVLNCETAVKNKCKVNLYFRHAYS